MAKKQTEEVTAITVVQESGGPVAVPAFLKDYMGKGTEHFTKDDLQLPRLGLAQGLSPQLNPEKPEYIKGLVLGDAFNSATNVIYGRGPWDIAVVNVQRPRWVEWIPREEGGGIKDPNVPFADPRTQWGPNGEKPKATKYYDMIVVFLETKETIGLSFKSKGIAVAKKFNTLIAKRGNVPLFMGRYTVRALMAQAAKGSYATLQIINNGHVESEEMLHFLAGQFDVFKDKTIIVDREPGADDDADENDEV